MNERIKALKEQAMRFAQEKCEGQSRDMYGTLRADIMTEKFAELIVQECMWKIMQRKEEAIDNDWRVDEAMSAALLDISEHFGVEE